MIGIEECNKMDLRVGTIEKVEEFDESRIYAVRRLNEIMESKGRY